MQSSSVFIIISSQEKTLLPKHANIYIYVCYLCVYAVIQILKKE